MKLDDMRRDYTGDVLNEHQLPGTPFQLFQSWLAFAIEQAVLDAHAFVLSTMSENSQPDSRVVLLKGIQSEKFVFFTNYESHKARQISKQNKVAMNFYWGSLARQVRILGVCEKTSIEDSQTYFLSRPIESQISAIISKQSHVIPSRETLLEQFKEFKQSGVEIKCPAYWGGYAIQPYEFEFFQGHPNRLHDRIVYQSQENGTWQIHRLAP